MGNEQLAAVIASIQSGLACKAAAERIKEAVGFEYIGEVPMAGGHFASHRLEHDYQMKHPVISTMHPGVYGGAALGIAASKYLANHGMLHGAVIGGSIGMLAEGAHRLNYLMKARKKLERGINPTNARYHLD